MYLRKARLAQTENANYSLMADAIRTIAAKYHPSIENSFTEAQRSEKRALDNMTIDCGKDVECWRDGWLKLLSDAKEKANA